MQDIKDPVVFEITYRIKYTLCVFLTVLLDACCIAHVRGACVYLLVSMIRIVLTMLLAVICLCELSTLH